MAFSSDSRHSGYKGVGVPQIGASFDKFQMDASPKFNIGFKVETGDGSAYRYTHFGADVNRGVLVSQDISESSTADTDNSVVAPASAVTTTDGTIGSRYVELTIASVTAQQFAGGKFITTDDTGEGYTYDVVSNTATNDPATGNIRIKLAQPLQVALDATTDFIINGSIYSNCEIATTTDAMVSGVTCSTMDVSEAAWGWVQTKGVVGILTDDSVPAVGNIITLSDTDSGAVGTMGNGGTASSDLITEPILGYCLVAADDTGHGSYKIIID